MCAHRNKKSEISDSPLTRKWVSFKKKWVRFFFPASAISCEHKRLDHLSILVGFFAWECGCT
jgi:hypothetical protein